MTESPHIRAARHAVVTALCLFVLACGGPSAPPVVVTTPFTPEMAEFFEDGADYIEDPSSLEGRWREDWSRELDQRVTNADVVAIVKVEYVRTDTNPDRQTTYRLVVKVERKIFGDPPDEIELTVAEDENGFASIDENQRRLLNARFVAFVKWYQTEAGEVAAHWHLSPDSQPITSRVEYLVERRHNIPRERGRTTTVVHE